VRQVAQRLEVGPRGGGGLGVVEDLGERRHVRRVEPDDADADRLEGGGMLVNRLLVGGGLRLVGGRRGAAGGQRQERRGRQKQGAAGQGERAGERERALGHGGFW